MVVIQSAQATIEIRCRWEVLRGRKRFADGDGPPRAAPHEERCRAVLQLASRELEVCNEKQGWLVSIGFDDQFTGQIRDQLGCTGCA